MKLTIEADDGKIQTVEVDSFIGAAHLKGDDAGKVMQFVYLNGPIVLAETTSRSVIETIEKQRQENKDWKKVHVLFDKL